MFPLRHQARHVSLLPRIGLVPTSETGLIATQQDVSLGFITFPKACPDARLVWPTQSEAYAHFRGYVSARVTCFTDTFGLSPSVLRAVVGFLGVAACPTTTFVRGFFRAMYFDRVWRV